MIDAQAVAELARAKLLLQVLFGGKSVSPDF
jgi:hypothetical protein